jgi:protein-export membrane protein, secD/secF family
MQRRRLFYIIATVLALIVAIVGLLPVYSDKAHLGLDLQGGVLVRLDAPKGTSAEDMNGAKEIINNRVNALGVSEPEVRIEGLTRITVELPGVENPEEAVKLIGTTAKLQFVRNDTGEIIFEGADLEKAAAFTNPKALTANDQYGVDLKLSSKGAEAFAKATSDLLAKYPGDTNRDKRIISIILDNIVISSPSVSAAIMDGRGQISGGFETLEEANNLATLLNSGALPIDLTITEQKTVGAQLGPDSVAKSINATLIGAIALVLFILLIYRGLGIVALLALILYSLLLAGSLIAIKTTITLPVVAAYLLSIGMAVDANVLIFERIKEELRVGKSIRVSVDAGFKKAFSTILDSNVTTLIAGVVLIILGTGTIRGFAVTLCIGILISLFTAISFTRFILMNLVASGVIKSSKYFGVRG